MQGFRQNANTLLWEGNYEKLLIEPWGSDSLRVRASIAAQVRDDLFSVLWGGNDPQWRYYGLHLLGGIYPFFSLG
jgi:hypothetical protein